MPDYVNDNQLDLFLGGDSSNVDIGQVGNIVSTTTNGIEALPYQFMESVDRRLIMGNSKNVGRKYAEKIFGRLPLLFLTPCKPLFMDDFTKSQREAGLDVILSGGNINSLLGQVGDDSGRFYSVEFNYAEYYRYLNTMLSCIAMYLGIYNTEIPFGDKDFQKIGKIDWSNELNSSFKTFFSCKENIIFYLDGLDRVDENFSNSTTESSLASQINGFSDMANEIRFLFGERGNAAADLVNSGSEITDNITSSFSGAASKLAGGIIGSLAEQGVNSVLKGGKVIFPEIWSDSDFSRSFTIDIKLRSPDHDSLSIFLNVLKPYCKLLALVLPKQPDGPNYYYSPFLVRAYSKGMFNVEMGMISSMSVSKGATCCWNDDGLPTQIDISIEIKDLYSKLGMTEARFDSLTSIRNAVQNTAFMDFLANTAGLNVGQMEIGRRLVAAYYLSNMVTATALSDVFNRFDQGVSRLIGKLYNVL